MELTFWELTFWEEPFSSTKSLEAISCIYWNDEFQQVDVFLFGDNCIRSGSIWDNRGKYCQ